jgi:hypothetical protein
MARILAVPGLEQTSAEFRRELWAMAARNAWDVDAIATVISIESGFNPSAKNPKATASGLIQFIDSTARSLGVAGGAAEVRTMSDVQQLALVEIYYRRANASSAWRPVDFYLAGWGSGIGAGFEHVLARQGENKYELNKGLDGDGSGAITVGDLDRLMKRQQAKAGGRFVDVDELGGTETGPLAPGPAAALPLRSLAQRLRSLQQLCAALPVLRVGDASPMLSVVQHVLGEQVFSGAPVYSPNLAVAVRLFQGRRRLKVDAVIGPKTWFELLEGLR